MLGWDAADHGDAGEGGACAPVATAAGDLNALIFRPQPDFT